MRFSAELPPVWHVQFEFSWPCDFRLYVVSKVPHWLSLSRPDVSLQRIMCSDMCMFVSTYESVCNLCAHLYSPATTMLAVNIHQNQWHVSVAMYNPDICTKHCTLCTLCVIWLSHWEVKVVEFQASRLPNRQTSDRRSSQRIDTRKCETTGYF